jgi:hypothetical protein
MTELDRLVVRPDVREPCRQLAEVRLEARWGKPIRQTAISLAAFQNVCARPLGTSTWDPAAAMIRWPSSSKPYDPAIT